MAIHCKDKKILPIARTFAALVRICRAFCHSLRPLAGNGGAWEGILCAYRCPVEGIAHGYRQLRGL